MHVLYEQLGRNLLRSGRRGSQVRRVTSWLALAVHLQPQRMSGR